MALFKSIPISPTLPSINEPNELDGLKYIQENSDQIDLLHKVLKGKNLLKERDYDTLCKFCDVLILEENLYRVAISWLHVIREHPIFLRQYNNIFRQKNLFLHFTTELLTGF